MANQLRTSGVFNLGSLGGDSAAVSADADFDSVVLLLDGEGSSITDESSSSHTITASGDTQVDTAEKKFGSGSIEFDGATDHLSATSSSDFTFGTGDFTIETWVKFRNGASDRDMTLFDNGAVNTAGHLCIFADVNNLYCRFGTSGATLTTSWTTLGMSNNNWNHLAVVRDSGTCRVFVNGVQKNSGTRNENLTATGCRIGTLSGYEAYYAFDGYLDDFRITKGVARYSSSFTPPTSALTNTVPSGTVELRMDGTDGAGSGSTTTDLSSFSHTGITSTDVTAGTTDSGVTRPDLYGGTKGYLDFTSSQAGRIVTLPTTVDLSSGDFTIECWVLFDTISQFRSFMRGGTGSASGTWQLQTYDSKISLLTGGASTYTITDSKTVTTNTWYHVALSYVSSTYTMTLSVDGNCTSLTNQTEFSNMQSSYLGGSGTNIQLGANRGGTVRHDGLLTDVRFTTGAALYPDLGRITPIPTAALPSAGTVAGATKPTRKWGGLVGRSLIASDALVKTGNLKLSELLQATYPASGAGVSYGVGTGGNNSYTATIDGQLYQFREFTSSGTFNVTTAGTFDVLLVGGGGEAGGRISGGGGGGAVMLTSTTHSGSGVTLTAGNHTITVGAGGTGGGNSAAGNNGGSTTAFNITATGGGGGGSYFQSAQTLGRDGANGGGAGAFATGTYSGGSGTAPTFPAGITGNVYAGYNGGSSQWASNISTGGGGGAAANGTDAASATAGNGGDGIQITNFEQTDYYYGGGGAGVYYSTTMGTGGKGGGAGSGDTNGRNTAGNGSGTNGAANTGGGGAGTLSNTDVDNGGAGGSGIVVIRYAI